MKFLLGVARRSQQATQQLIVHFRAGKIRHRVAREALGLVDAALVEIDAAQHVLDDVRRVAQFGAQLFDRTAGLEMIGDQIGRFVRHLLVDTFHRLPR